MSLGVVIGRFQVDDLHLGHRNLLTFVRNLHPGGILVMIGDGVRNRDNPLSYENRRWMVQEFMPSAFVKRIEDVPSDELWSKRVDASIRGFWPGSSTLYGGEDSFIPRYSGELKTVVLPMMEHMSGTNSRGYIRGLGETNSRDFRRGVIWATR